MKTIAIVLAGGQGRRVGGPVPKQLLMLGGRRVIEWSVGTMNDAAEVDEVVIVAGQDCREEIETIVARAGWPKVVGIVDGGTTRAGSVKNALDSLACDEANVLIHDAARPLVSHTIIYKVCEALREKEAVGVAVRASDTVWQVGAGVIVDVPDRGQLWLAQTPQAFRLSLIRRAHALAASDPAFDGATDDCGLLRRYLPHCPVAVVEGERRNMKLTYSEDLKQLEALLSEG